MPSRAIRFEAMAIVCLPSNTMEPSRRAIMPMMALERRRLARAVAAEQRHDFAAAHFELDAVQDVRLAVPGVQVLHGEERCGLRRLRHEPVRGRLARRADRAPRRCVVALRNDLAALEHRNLLTQVGDHGQIVLDHDHGAIPRGAPYQRGDALDVLLRHAGRRLVEQHDLRIERERRRDLERAFAAIRQLPGGHGFESAEADCIDQLARAVVQHSSTRSDRQKSKEAPRFRCSATLTFSSTVRCGKTAEIWNERTIPMRAIAAGLSP